MNPDVINRTIAGICGWVFREVRAGYASQGSFWCKGKEAHKATPDYFNDLNACAKFEQTLTDTQSYVYRDTLRVLAAKYQITDICGSSGHDYFSKAPQRCEAFLRLHGQWKETVL